jgi:hypothetical protein
MALAVEMVGVVLDGRAYKIGRELRACVDYTGNFYGDPFDYLDACTRFTQADCSCVTADGGCHYYSGGVTTHSCNDVMGYYVDVLLGALVMDSLGAIAVFVLAILLLASMSSPAPQQYVLPVGGELGSHAKAGLTLIADSPGSSRKGWDNIISGGQVPVHDEDIL